MKTAATALALIVTTFASAAHARTLMTQRQALTTAFPPPLTYTRQTFALTPPQVAQVKKAADTEIVDPAVVRYAASNGSFAYFDTHHVRGGPEVVMIVLDAKGRIARVDVIDFEDETKYFPKQRWLTQLIGRSGKNLPSNATGPAERAIVKAARKIFAIHALVR